MWRKLKNLLAQGRSEAGISSHQLNLSPSRQRSHKNLSKAPKQKQKHFPNGSARRTPKRIVRITHQGGCARECPKKIRALTKKQGPMRAAAEQQPVSGAREARSHGQSAPGRDPRRVGCGAAPAGNLFWRLPERGPGAGAAEDQCVWPPQRSAGCAAACKRESRGGAESRAPLSVAQAPWLEPEAPCLAWARRPGTCGRHGVWSPQWANGGAAGPWPGSPRLGRFPIAQWGSPPW